MSNTVNYDKCYDYFYNIFFIGGLTLGFSILGNCLQFFNCKFKKYENRISSYDNNNNNNNELNINRIIEEKN
jgi:hypothetical protein